jgi:2,3-dihydroxy-p-cumate/2,3-dihydroxybenzoate 3,4-dioxygenase
MTIGILDIAYTRLKTPDLGHATDFATRILGLEVVDRARDRGSFRSDHRMCTMSYETGDPSETIVGFELADGTDLESAAATLEALGHAVRRGSHEEREHRWDADRVRCCSPDLGPWCDARP